MDPQQPQTLPPTASPATASSSSAATANPALHNGQAVADDPKAVKRVRTSRPKVKTGCNNCKKRRIKCDEVRPECTQCVRAKKACSGYPPPPRGARPFEEIRIAPKPGPTLLVAAPRPGLAPAPPRAGTPLAPALPRPLAVGSYYAHPPQQVQLVPRRAQKVQRRTMEAKQNALAAATAAARATPAMFYEPSMCLPFSQNEGLYFQLFRTQTANELSGFFDDVFWSRSVLVECHSAPAIRHAVVALGALYKTLEKTTESPPTSPSARPYAGDGDTAYRHWEVAIKQYTSAFHALAAVSDHDESAQRTRLMAIVLLACFDSFIGDHKQAIVQIQMGLGMLDRIRTEHRRGGRQASSSSVSGSPEPVEDELAQMFARLAIQAKSYDMAFHFPHPYVIQLLPSSAHIGAPAAAAAAAAGDGSSSSESPPAGSDTGSPVLQHQDLIPERFVSVRQARLSWDTLLEQIFRFMELMLHYAKGPPNLLPKSMKSYGLGFQARIEAWAVAFEPLLVNRMNAGVTSQEKASIAVLKMFQIMAQILYLMTFSDSEMAFDGFQPLFKAIVDLASEVVSDEERRAAALRCPDPARCVHRNGDRRRHVPASEYHKGFSCAPGHIKASFSADLGIVPPLFVVATKSRDRMLRRRAIQLLRSSARREGMWDSELVARIAMWVVDIEEEGEEQEFLQQMAGLSVGGGVGGAGTVGGVSSYSGMAAAANMPSPASSTSSSSQTFGAGEMPVSSMSATGSVDYGSAPLGPGGNARWDTQRASQQAAMHTHSHAMVPYYMQIQRPVPAEKRILVKACEFDLREHTATLKCGTRGLATGLHDSKTRVTQIRW